MPSWSPIDLLPGLWVALLGWLLAAVLRRGFDPVPRRIWAAWAFFLLLLFGPVLFAGRVLLPLGYLTKVPPYTGLWDGPGPPPGNLLQSDLVLQITPWMVRMREAFAAGEWPLWNHLAGAGEPLLGNPQTQAWQPLAWLALPFPPAAAVGVLAALRVLTALAFSYLFFRRQGLSQAVAFAAGTAYGLGGGLLLWLNWPMANSAALLPLLFYAIVLVDERGTRRDQALLAAAVLALLGAGHPETILHVSLLAAGFSLARLAARPRGTRRRLLVSWTLAAAIGFGLAAPALLPAAGYLPQSLRVRLLDARQEELSRESPLAGWRTADERAASRRALAERLLPLAAPNAYGNNRFGRYWGESNVVEDASGFAGTLTLLAALLAFLPARGRRLPQERLFLAAALLALAVLALPPGMARLLNALPVLRDSFTLHHRLLLALGFCLTYLAGCAWERWRRDGPPRAALLMTAAGLAILVAWAYLGHPNPKEPASLAGLRHASLAVQMAVLAGFSVFVLARRRSGAWGALGVLVAAELLFFHLPANPPAPAVLFYPETPALSFLHQNLDPWHRMAGIGPALRANLPSVHGLADPRTSNPAKPGAIAEALAPINRFPNRATDGFAEPLHPLYTLLGARYLVTAPGMALPSPLVPVYRGPDAWIFEQPRALPRLFLPRSTVPCAAAAWRDCTRPIGNFRRRSAVRGEPWSESAPGASKLELLDLQPARIQARARLSEPRLLATSIFQDGEWTVLADGKKQAATLANGPFLAAWLPAGNLRLDLIYRPRSFVLGMVIAALAFAAAVAFWVPPARPREEGVRESRGSPPL